MSVQGERLAVLLEDAVGASRPSEFDKQRFRLLRVICERLKILVVPHAEARWEELRGCRGIAKDSHGQTLAVDRQAQGLARLGIL